MTGEPQCDDDPVNAALRQYRSQADVPAPPRWSRRWIDQTDRVTNARWDVRRAIRSKPEQSFRDGATPSSERRLSVRNQMLTTTAAAKLFVDPQGLRRREASFVSKASRRHGASADRWPAAKHTRLLSAAALAELRERNSLRAVVEGRGFYRLCTRPGGRTPVSLPERGEQSGDVEGGDRGVACCVADERVGTEVAEQDGQVEGGDVAIAVEIGGGVWRGEAERCG